MPHRTIYASRSLIGGWGPDLLDIARASFARNAALGVTGALYFDALRFVQVLEGPAPAVAALMQAIRADRRHFDLRVLEDGAQDGRRFGRWSMRFVDGTAAPALREAVPAAGPLSAAEAERLVDALAEG